MKTATHILDKSVFAFTWLTIAIVSTTLATVFFKGIGNLL